MHRYHLSIFLLTITAFVVAFYIYNNISPYNGEEFNYYALGTLLISASTVIAGIYTFLSYPIKSVLYPHEDSRYLTRVAIRQGFLLALCFISFILLNLFHTLNIFTAVLSVLIIITVELSFRD